MGGRGFIAKDRGLLALLYSDGECDTAEQVWPSDPPWRGSSFVKSLFVDWG